MNAKLTNTHKSKSTNQESDLFEISVHELTTDEILAVAGGASTTEPILPPR
jgi:hypothetical protein